MMKIKRLMAFVLALILAMSVFTVFASAESVGLGDLDGNGAVDSSDYIEIKEKFLSGAVFSAEETKLADVNGDGIVSSADVVTVVATVRGEVRLPVHAYDNACDADCNLCGHNRTVGDHVYDSASDYLCNECGASRGLVVGINARRIGSGYAELIKADFEEYMKARGLSCAVTYTSLGDSSTNAAGLGDLVRAAGNIDVLLAAGNNVDSASGSALTIKEKAYHVVRYNDDGSRYAARLTDNPLAETFYDFVTGQFKPEPIRSKTDTLDILFIGNSFTYYNDMPTAYFAPICKEGGYKVNVTAITNGGHYLYEFADPNDTYGAQVKTALTNNKYDIVIIQDQSRGPIVSPTKFYNAARTLAAMVKTNGAELYFYSTWGYKAGYKYLPDCGGTTEIMEMKLRAAYSAIAEEVGAKLVYAGVAMLDIHQNTTINVYQDDLFHPRPAGSLTVAYTFYATLFGEDPRGLTFTAGLTEANVAKLRQAAFEASFYPNPVDAEYVTSTK
jgi:hypothetical protein